eukprot:symbB.v1.2.037464.t1/scaffold5536.1/size26037/1
MQAAFLLLLSCSELCSAYLLADVMTREKCEEVIDLAKTAGLSPSFEKGRLLDPELLKARMVSSQLKIDVNQDGIISSSEAGLAAQSLLNAPMFGAEDGKKWLRSVLPDRNLSVKWLEANLDVFAFRSIQVLQELLAKLPEKFSRFSWQVPLLWSQLPTLAQHLALVARDLWDSGVGPPQWLEDGITVESLQVIRYSPGGHYAQHSDSGWPGHRLVSLLLYLRAPAAGGETCLLPDSWNFTWRISPGRYRKHCAHLFEAVSCQRPWCAGVTIGKTFAWKFQHITVLMYSPG